MIGSYLLYARAAIRGGNWNNEANAGVFALNLNNAPSNSNNNIGLRVAIPKFCQIWMGQKPFKRAHNDFGDMILASGAKNINRLMGAGRETERPHRPQNEMKTYRNLWAKIATFEALHAAYLKARRGKRFAMDTLRFSANLEQEIGALANELQSGIYHTGEYRRFSVFEPKKREIAALPFRDRVVHHALVSTIEPIFECRFSRDSYACRVGKGTHAGADRLTVFLRHAGRMWQNVYVLKADIAKYFPSIDHTVLKAILRRKIACPETLALIDNIINSWNGPTGKGLPIGNLTSQLFANIYLNELDQFVKQVFRWRFYLRYVDDFILIGGDKVELNNAKRVIQEFLRTHLLLELNKKTSIFPAKLGVDFLGYRIWKTHRLLRKRSVTAMRRKLSTFQKLYANGEIDPGKIKASVMSWLGHAKHANTYTLQKRLLGNFILRRE